MPPKPNSHKWTDIQTAIATVAVVTTLGLWNLFAQPEKKVTVQAEEPLITPPPAEVPAAAAQPVQPTAMPQQPQAKIMFTQVAPQVLTNNLSSQPQNTNTSKKKKNSGGTVTQTKTS